MAPFFGLGKRENEGSTKGTFFWLGFKGKRRETNEGKTKGAPQPLCASAFPSTSHVTATGRLRRKPWCQAEYYSEAWGSGSGWELSLVGVELSTLMGATRSWGRGSQLDMVVVGTHFFVFYIFA